MPVVASWRGIEVVGGVERTVCVRDSYSASRVDWARAWATVSLSRWECDLNAFFGKWERVEIQFGVERKDVFMYLLKKSLYTLGYKIYGSC